MGNGAVEFQGRKIRRLWHNNEWHFSVADIVEILTDSRDPKQYLKKLRQRDNILNSNWGTICTPLQLLAPDGKLRTSNCANTIGLFRIIQSIPSKKAEPFKRWLAKVGYERIQEIENPRLAVERAKHYFKLKQNPKGWTDTRLFGIGIRHQLTQEWKLRGIGLNREFAILTNEISEAVFGMPVKSHKAVKGIKR
ncbi:MAG: Bro-N domain-containing protein [Candidatus Woesearchaeota archaeon]